MTHFNSPIIYGSARKNGRTIAAMTTPSTIRHRAFGEARRIGMPYRFSRPAPARIWYGLAWNVRRKVSICGSKISITDPANNSSHSTPNQTAVRRQIQRLLNAKFAHLTSTIQRPRTTPQREKSGLKDKLLQESIGIKKSVPKGRRI